MLTFPNIKINLGLNVVSRRADGYHNIESVFYPVGLSDILEFTLPGVGDALQWTMTGLDCGADMERNLCVRAFRLLAGVRQLPPLSIHLHKIIPAGAGLGGGSSDGSFVLCRLNEMLELGFSDNELERMAARLGADCPFFVRNSPTAVSGIGDVLEPYDVPTLVGRQIVIVKPDVFVSTAQAYAGVVPQEPARSVFDIVRQDIGTWKADLRNDFEKPVFALFPVIAQVKQKLYDCGALYAQMSGSGSSVFAIFDSTATLPIAEDFPQMFFWHGIL